ncbi:NAD(+)/NADH kinase [Acidipila sp. EB88]|uniref:NAD(+)/NADH kinase n=1 Tax=Acidipila sp. EB88 TaxID=2305226 RepID=UPI000F5E1EE9|nr:NAD(+)/NADH kinase [Acidipila sp. EB88]RRA49436.1 NAD(+)/NADH kinase [Acidipila sp. EB88]
MRTIAIVSKPEKPELREILVELIGWLRDHDFTPVLDAISGSYTDAAPVVARESLSEHVPVLVIVLGGDGTLLAASRVFAHLGTPILSVNLGSLGFLTEVRLSDLYTTLEAWCVDCGALDVRTMLHTELWRGNKLICENEALNDAVITKGTIARMGYFSVSVDGHLAAEYRADGVIVATPTGSTAYSLSANGPVLDPSVDAHIVTPVCPHLLTMRPLVVRGDARLKIRVISGDDPTFFTVDGQESQPLEAGDELRCWRSEHKVKLLRVGTGSFYDVLRTKLKWGTR